MTGALIGQTTKVVDLEACTAKCTVDTTCLSISFKAVTSHCRLSSRGASGNLKADVEYEVFDKIVPTQPPDPTPTPPANPGCTGPRPARVARLRRTVRAGTACGSGGTCC